MTIEAVFNTIRTKFKADIADTYSLQVQYDNAPFVVDESTELTLGSWIRFTIQLGESLHALKGEPKTFRTQGVAIAQIHTTWERGDRDALKIADYIIAAFRAVTVSGVVLKTPYLRRVGRTSEGKWWQINVFCPFYFDDIV